MRLTQYSDFALRVLIYLATIPNNDELVRIDDIAKSYGISKNHLTKVIHQLSKLKVVDSARVKTVAFVSNAPQNINVGNIVRQTEPDFFVVACFFDEPAQDDLMTDNLMTNDLRKIKTLICLWATRHVLCHLTCLSFWKASFCRSHQGILQVLDSYVGGHHQQRR